MWVRKGSRPRVGVQQRYEWLSLYGFVHPHSGRTEWLILPTVDLEMMNLALAHFAQAVGASNDKHIALVLDQAGWHASALLQVPQGLHLIFLPPYSPNCSPVNGSGRCPMKALLHVGFLPLTRLKRRKSNGAKSCYNNTTAFTIPRAFTGGLPTRQSTWHSKDLISPLLEREPLPSFPAVQSLAGFQRVL
ncbi:transposase [Dictyobacter formicarum]|uniref:transposase n=1 Tax=Dictyobacter formicarum TaxID=2778368 RepID=UPI001F290B08|nr:transposase [Dictyobacter formicarum]